MADEQANRGVRQARPAVEVLAPAGSWEALEAAMAAGASAVYLGLKVLNARRGAKNFSQDEFARAVQAAHAHGAKAYLTLNIDLAERELGQAARILELARQAGADAVLVRDPGLLALQPFFPNLEFHFSTQTCMSSSADVEAARELGAKRVVLARELTLGEIAAASAVEGVQTEVFVQGALCFCISGRCLLSSWVGGRSGNRGACTSPCRVPYSAQGQPLGTPLSMRDLSLVHRLKELAQAGVASLKIEGRLKTAAWVGKAVNLYRRALAGEEGESLLKEAGELGAYTGRALTWGYLDGKREELTGLAVGRTTSNASGGEARLAPSPCTQGEGWGEGQTLRPPSPSEPAFQCESVFDACAEAAEEEQETPADATYDLSITIGEKGIVCRCACEGRHIEWSMPKTVVHRAYKAITVGQALAFLAKQQIRDRTLAMATSNDEAFLLVPRAVNALVDQISSAIRQCEKSAPDEQVRIDLPEPVRQLLESHSRHPANQRCLGARPNRVRLEASAVAEFVRRVRASGVAEARPDAIIVENLTAHALPKVLAAAAGVPLVAALPAVFFEGEIPALRQLLAACLAAGLRVEVNSWGGWRLARQIGLLLESGPGLGTLNSLAARALGERGIECVTLSVEADRKQLEELAARAPVPCSMIVYGRPALLTTRAHLPREQFLGKVLADRRGVRLTAHPERGLWVFRPLEPFDLRNVRNDRIRVSNLVVDLVGAKNPAAEWLNAAPRQGKAFRFNYGRTLA